MQKLKDTLKMADLSQEVEYANVVGPLASYFLPKLNKTRSDKLLTEISGDSKSVTHNEYFIPFYAERDKMNRLLTVPGPIE